MIKQHNYPDLLPFFFQQLRELYTAAMTKEVWTTPEYKECKQLLSYLSKDDLIEKIKKVCHFIDLF